MDIKKFEKIISDLSNLRKENIINDDINKYRNSPLIKDLNLTDKEFISFGAVIKQIVDENEKCKNTPNDCPLSSKYHLKLIRDKNNLIKIVSEMCEKYRRVNIIKPNYLIRDFSSSDLNKTMNDLIIENDNESKKQLFKLFTRCIEQFKNNEQSYNRGIFLYGYMGVGKTF
jgi:DNA replication protein DnaC